MSTDHLFFSIPNPHPLALVVNKSSALTGRGMKEKVRLKVIVIIINFNKSQRGAGSLLGGDAMRQNVTIGVKCNINAKCNNF